MNMHEAGKTILFLNEIAKLPAAVTSSDQYS